jgi:hypothetical protein
VFLKGLEIRPDLLLSNQLADVLDERILTHQLPNGYELLRQELERSKTLAPMNHPEQKLVDAISKRLADEESKK